MPQEPESTIEESVSFGDLLVSFGGVLASSIGNALGDAMSMSTQMNCSQVTERELNQQEHMTAVRRYFSMPMT